jgi:polysaccharide export outer membrane protein
MGPSRALLWLGVGMWLTAGCASAGRPAAPATPRAETPSPAAAAPRPALPPAPLVSLQPPAAVSEEDYKLAPRDQVAITVFGQKDLTRTVRLSQSGAITLPLLGEIEAAGLSTSELERRIEDGLRGRYLVSPKATVTVSEFGGRQFAVMGAVNQPGAFALKSNYTTVMVALSEAKGVKDGSDRIAYVLRAHPRVGEPQPVTVDLDALLRQGDPGHNVVVEPGDSIYVPEANTFYVAGEVEKKGAFPLRRDTTISRAITEAGGVAKHAATGDIRVIRTLPTGAKQEIGPFDLDKVMGGDRRQDIALQPQDIVVVPESGAKRFGYGFLDVLKSILRFSLIAL